MLLTSSQPYLFGPKFVFIALLIFRIFNSQLLQTFFQPDEYFQSLEPAWQLAFGKESGAWITWEWKERLRSSIHPMIFATAYRIAEQMVKLFTDDQYIRTRVLSVTPRLLQAFIAATTDFYTWQLAKKVSDPSDQSSLAALALTVFSPWQWFCSTRTFSNCLETALTTIALSYFPWHWLQLPGGSSINHNSTKGLNLALTCAASACILRPTNILVWFAISGGLLWNCGFSATIGLYIHRAVLCGSIVLTASVGLDRIYYQTWTFPPLRFLYFNIVQSLAGFYGKNRPDYYFTEGLPLLLTTATPLALFGIWQSLQPVPTQNSRRLRSGRIAKFLFTMAITTTVVVLSLISHKEVRFIYPLLPMLNILSATPLARFAAPGFKGKSAWRLLALGLAIAINVGITIYVGLIHQRGVIDVMYYLRRQQEIRMPPRFVTESSVSFSPTGISIGFLMPCHSTPWRTHLAHPQTNAWALTCEPPINKSQIEKMTYMDEADVFYKDPAAWIKANMEDVSTISSEVEYYSKPVTSLRPWPEYLVFFENLTPILKPVLKQTRYKRCRRLFNTHWHDDWRREGDVIVWCMRTWRHHPQID